MIRKEGKVLKFICDLCKTEEVKDRGMLRYTARDRETVLWDICSSCLPKIKEQLGPGREYDAPQIRSSWRYK